MNIEIVAVSRDLAPSQGIFKKQVDAKNTFLSDVDAVVIKKFGANDDVRKFAKRYYFLIDESGKIRVEGIDPGSCELSFPDLDQDAWEQA